MDKDLGEVPEERPDSPWRNRGPHARSWATPIAAAAVPAHANVLAPAPAGPVGEAAAAPAAAAAAAAAEGDDPADVPSPLKKQRTGSMQQDDDEEDDMG